VEKGPGSEHVCIIEARLHRPQPTIHPCIHPPPLSHTQTTGSVAAHGRAARIDYWARCTAPGRAGAAIRELLAHRERLLQQFSDMYLLINDVLNYLTCVVGRLGG
jgi:hypothetical protein